MRNYVFAGAVVLLLLLSAAYLGARSVYDTELSNAGAAFDPGARAVSLEVVFRQTRQPPLMPRSFFTAVPVAPRAVTLR